MVSNALSGLHYGPGASLAPVVPYDFLSDEPYLLSKCFHLNSINLSKLPWASAAEHFPISPAGCWCCCPGHRGHPQPRWLGVFGGARPGPPAAPRAVEHVSAAGPFAVHPLRRLPRPPYPSCRGSLYAPIIERVCNAESFPGDLPVGGFPLCRGGVTATVPAPALPGCGGGC